MKGSWWDARWFVALKVMICVVRKGTYYGATVFAAVVFGLELACQIGCVDHNMNTIRSNNSGTHVNKSC